ncbi:HEAT repeat domain-containing protein [Candidatus Latescibacterota bacterium]
MAICRVIVALAVAVVGLALCNPAAAESEEYVEHEFQRAYSLILERKWEEAEEAFQKLLDDIQDDGKPDKLLDDILFWHCYTIAKSGKLERAFDCYNTFTEEQHRSQWVDDAKAAMIRLAQQLAEGGKKEYAIAIAALEHGEDDQTLLTALAALARLGDDTAIEAIRDLYSRSKMPKVNLQILQVLSRMDSDQGRALMADIATKDPDYETRKSAAEFLGFSRQEGALPILERVAFEDDVLEVQLAAVNALYRFPGTGGADLLIKVIREHPVGAVRRNAVDALSRTEDPRVRETLLELLSQE